MRAIKNYILAGIIGLVGYGCATNSPIEQAYKPKVEQSSNVYNGVSLDEAKANLEFLRQISEKHPDLSDSVSAMSDEIENMQIGKTIEDSVKD